MKTNALLLGVMCCLAGQFVTVRPQMFSDISRLASDLFTNYSMELRPLKDATTPTEIRMGLWLSSIIELDELNQMLTFSAYLYIDWIDPSLSWTPANYNNTMYFAYPQKYMWIPDVTIINSVETMEELGFDRNYLYIESQGRIKWRPGGVFQTACEIDVTFYPFDTQTCEIIFSTLVSSDFEIDLRAHPDHNVDLRLYSPSASWSLVDITSEHTVDSSKKTRETFYVKFKRLRTYYLLSMIIPVLFLAFTATLVFALPADSGEKMGTSITVLLSYAVYLTLLSDHMPQTSLNISVLAVYLNIVLGQTALGVVLSVWILNLHFRDEERAQITPRMRRIVINLQHLMRWRKKSTVQVLKDDKEEAATNGAPPASTVYKTNVMDGAPSRPMTSFGLQRPTGLEKRPLSGNRNDGDSEGMEGAAITWQMVSLTFDRFIFYTSSIILVLVTLVFMSTLVIGGELST